MSQATPSSMPSRMVVDKLSTDAILAEEQNKVLLNVGYDVTRLTDGRKLVLITVTVARTSAMASSAWLQP